MYTHLHTDTDTHIHTLIQTYTHTLSLSKAYVYTHIQIHKCIKEVTHSIHVFFDLNLFYMNINLKIWIMKSNKNMSCFREFCIIAISNIQRLISRYQISVGKIIVIVLFHYVIEYPKLIYFTGIYYFNFNKSFGNYLIIGCNIYHHHQQDSIEVTVLK